MRLRRKRETPSDEWEVPTKEIPTGQTVIVTVAGNRNIARALQTFAAECERGTVFSLKVEYEKGDEFTARARFSDLVDPASLNLPGEVQIFAEDPAPQPSRSVITDIGPPAPSPPGRVRRKETVSPDSLDLDEEDTGVHTPRAIKEIQVYDRETDPKKYRR